MKNVSPLACCLECDCYAYVFDCVGGEIINGDEGAESFGGVNRAEGIRENC